MKLLVRNGRVIDPENNLDEVCDIMAENSKISKVAKNIKAEADKVLNAEDKIVIPGIVDMHVHLREPGREDKESICSGTKAALKGGVTSVLAMPNTSPAIDSIENIKLLSGLIEKSAKANVFICAAITRGRKGIELVEIAKLVKEGAIAISDDGASVDSQEVMLEALKGAALQKIPVICHCEDKTLSNNGVVNLGFTSTRMGLRGISKESEYKRVQRDIDLAQKTNAAIHIAHVSCKESLELIAKAKKKGIKVTCETAPHYFCFSEKEVLGYDANFKMNPPLRSKEDMDAIKKSLSDGTIDVIASDHAPHTENEKEIEFERAEFGITGLETELSAAVMELVEKKILGWPELVEKFCVNPARILGVKKGTLKPGADADIVIFNPHKEWSVKKEDFISKSKNSPFISKRLKGMVEYTICNGKIAYKNGIHS